MWGLCNRHIQLSNRTTGKQLNMIIITQREQTCTLYSTCIIVHNYCMLFLLYNILVNLYILYKQQYTLYG